MQTRDTHPMTRQGRGGSRQAAIAARLADLEAVRASLIAAGRQDEAAALLAHMLHLRALDDREVTILAPRIISDPAVLGGAPVLAGTRIPVWLILGRFAAGEREADVQHEFPFITKVDCEDAFQVASEVLEQLW